MPRSNSKKPATAALSMPAANHHEISDQSNVVGRSRLWWAIPAFVVVGLIRLVAAGGDLAIDEIWSLWFVQNVFHHFLHIIALRHDNNHLLNSMIMYGMGPNLPGLCYRIPAAIASIGSVWLAGLIAMRRGGMSACMTTAGLVGASYLCILYGSEARGYSYAVFFAYLSWLFLLRTEQSRSRVDASIFTVSCCLGFLAHLTFLYCYAGFVVWTIWKWLNKRSSILLIAHLPVLVIALGLYLFFIRGMGIGGGTETNLMLAIVSTLSVAAGGPASGDAALIVAALTMLLLGAGFFYLWQSDRAMAACFLTIILLAPAAVLLVTAHQLIYPRYFLVPVAFGLLLVGDFAASGWQRGTGRRIVNMTVIGLYLVGNLWWTALLFDHGRGDYSHAMRWMAEQGINQPATVSSDHDFRNRFIFEYYSRRIWNGDAPLHYVTQQELPAAGTDWAIMHDFEDDSSLPEMQQDRLGNKYQLKRTFRHHSLTGWNWWIYQRVGSHR